MTDTRPPTHKISRTEKRNSQVARLDNPFFIQQQIPKTEGSLSLNAFILPYRKLLLQKNSVFCQEGHFREIYIPEDQNSISKTDISNQQKKASKFRLGRLFQYLAPIFSGENPLGVVPCSVTHNQTRRVFQ